MEPSPTASRVSQVDRVYQEIKAKIVYGTYRPGTHLSEGTLARVHRTSRTPIREALNRLCEERYVVTDPGRGFIIAPITVATIRNLYQVRRLLEGAAAAIAAATATPDEIAEMERVARYDYEVGNTDSYRTAIGRNLDFHLAIASATHNEILVDLVRRSLMQLDRVLSLGADFRRFHQESSAEHMAIIEAIRSREPERARREAERHSDHGNELMSEALTAGTIRGIVF